MSVSVSVTVLRLLRWLEIPDDSHDNNDNSPDDAPDRAGAK
jgi:hypothetical protein